ncbi:hypothetical protein [Sphingomonas sp. KR3-1]|uniref:hypothetical protein n=1 Tax=Sphingomonas sp. KR3-1 TaxID=3156611 RepID=UPI0032B5E653
MGQIVSQLIVTKLPLLVFGAIGIVLLLRGRATRAPRVAPHEVAAGGTMAVPIRALYLRRGGILGSKSHNNLNPRFAIAPEGIRYRVFRESRLAFSDIGHVEVRTRFGFVYLLFVNNAGLRLLSVNVGDRGNAKLVLDALPRTVALTHEAATIRDGTAAAGTSGLHLYSGRFA